MAKVLIYPAYQVGGLETLIKSAGHTPIYKTESLFSLEHIQSIGSPGFGDDDVILIICTLLDAHISPSIVPTAKALNAAGYILTMGQTNYGTTESISLTYNLGLATSLEVSRGEGNLILTQNKLIKNDILKLQGYVGINRTISACRDLLTPSFVVGYSSTYPSEPLVVVWEGGVMTRTGFKLVAPIIYLSFTWSFVYSNDWLLFFNDLINYCKLMIKSPYKISGSVKDLKGNPLVREVVAYSSQSYELVQKTITDDSGIYNLKLPTQDKVTVMFIPLETEKPEVHFNVIPEENIEE